MDVLEADSADGWETVVSGCFVPLRCAGFEPNFVGRMEHTTLDDRLSVSLVTTSGTSAERTESLASVAGSDDVHISLQRSSSGTVAQRGRATAVAPGSVTVYATDRQYYLDYSRHEQQQLIVQVSRSSLGVPSAMFEAAMWRLNVPGGVQSVAAGNLFSYAATLPDGFESNESARTMRDLASVMLRNSFGSSAVPMTSGGLRHAVRQHLRANATKRGIDMATVAREHFVSRRRLYQVFEQTGLSPGAFLRTERLRLATRMLSEQPSRTIEQIAYASGFDDLRTFERSFRRTYDCTPSEWRAAR